MPARDLERGRTPCRPSCWFRYRAVTAKEVETAKSLYYQMAGWDEMGRPTRAKLDELALDWVADELGL
jgi:aldehyde:ferredoxin oxidoreductase